jgi:Rrf2 family transcriptional regulator, cysteine metabolism repressor
MKISTKIRYGARAMLELASNYGKGPVELREIAERESISPKYLEQVIVPLRTAGLIKSVRGSKGGYVLVKPPSEVFLRDVIEILQGPLSLVECLHDSKVCQRSPTCVTRDIWNEVSEAISRIFNSISLEDMVKRKMEKERNAPPMYQI